MRLRPVTRRGPNTARCLLTSSEKVPSVDKNKPTRSGRTEAFRHARTMAVTITGIARNTFRKQKTNCHAERRNAPMDRIVFMDKGEIIEENDPGTFFTAPQTARAQAFLNLMEY